MIILVVVFMFTRWQIRLLVHEIVLMQKISVNVG